MENLDFIQDILRQTRIKYHLDDYYVKRALFFATFGQGYFDEALENIITSKAVRALIQNRELGVFIITSCNTDVTFCPASINLIRVDPVAEWPEHGRYQNRFFKWGIPFLFPNIETSIYLDSNIMITDKTSRLIHFFKLIMRKHFIVTDHRDRRGWKDEYEAIIRQRLCFDPKKLQEQVLFFAEQGLSTKIPVCMNNVLGRLHHSDLNALNLSVLSQVLRFSERDQLAFIYAMRKTKQRPFIAPEGRYFYRRGQARIKKTLCFIASHVKKERLLCSLGWVERKPEERSKQYLSDGPIRETPFF